MSIFGRREEPRSWSGQTASELSAESNGQSGGEQPYTPPKCAPPKHLSPVVRSKDRSKRTRDMSCQACGKNWTESY